MTNFNFRRLQMAPLKTSEIPDVICDIEYHGDTTKLNYFKDIVQVARSEENAYIEAFTAMIQLEEAFNSKYLKKFDLECVKIEMYSRADQIFHIQFDVNIQRC